MLSLGGGDTLPGYKSRPMNAKEFFNLVEAMRQEQRRWEADKSWTARKHAKRYEQLVDLEIDRVRRILPKEKDTQLKLL